MSSVPKVKRYESKQYIEFIKQIPCLVCGNPDVDPHHSMHTKGSGGSDLMCLPLCRREHANYHSWGLTKFEENHDIDIRDAMLRLLETYIKQLEHYLYGRDT